MSILHRCLDAAKGHEAANGDGSRCLFQDVADELKRLYAIERDVKMLLAYADQAKTGTHQGRYWDPIKSEYATLEGITERRIEAGKRLMQAVAS
ncbi:MAG: hypothetical protein ACLGJC_05145 [Alphaproteobacteria bacterium]